jgi:hypothetical protein
MKKLSRLLCSALILTSVAVSFVACAHNGDDGRDGINGVNGTSITWKGSLNSAPNNPEYLWAYYNTKDKCSYVWTGTEWSPLAGPAKDSYDVEIAEFTTNSIGIKGHDNLGQIGLAFKKDSNGNPIADIPYVAITPELFAFADMKVEVSEVKADSTTVTLINTKRNTSAVFDLSARTLAFQNYDLFFKNSDDVFMDATDCRKCDYMKITDYSNIEGQPIALGWATQDIGVCLWKEGDKYQLAVPLQFFNDVFLSPSMTFLIYNGKDLYLSSALQDTYWSEGDKSGTRSKALAEFCYNELCLNLDFNYGLKAIHGIEQYPDFDTYFQCVGLKTKLQSTDAEEFSKSLKDVCEFYFGDGHSNYLENSHYLLKTKVIKGDKTSAQDSTYNVNMLKYIKARKESLKYGDYSAPGYVVSTDGKTAIVRFDEFTLKEMDKATKKAYTDNGTFNSINANYAHGKDADGNSIEELYDTVALIHYVNEQIQNNPTIENVVLDLSCNGGGANHSAGFVLAWMLGKCTFDFTNPITGAKWSATYEADVNFDGKYDANDPTVADKKDTISDKNLFCLISPCSFSCGNMVPAMLKASNRVSILGVTSSGGSSCVQPSSTADGTTFRMSSKYVMSFNKNGSNYDIDRGVEPDLRISKPANFYNIAALAGLVDSIK